MMDNEAMPSFGSIYAGFSCQGEGSLTSTEPLSRCTFFINQHDYDSEK